MASRSLQFLPPAERFLDDQDRATIRYLIDACRLLRDDPAVDGDRKVPYLMAPVVYRLWTDGRYWIIYDYLRKSETVVIYEIGRED